MNNYERIKQMSIDEMAEHYCKLAKAMFKGANSNLAKDGIQIEYDGIAECKDAFIEWLESEEE